MRTAPSRTERGPGLVVAVLGPTGVGKTAVVTELARRLDTCVISCDSMQVYRGFPVLTNQPPAGEGVRHELVGCVDPGRPVSAAEYARLATPIVRRQLAAVGWALMAGGTGLYMRAALAPLAVSSKADPDRRRVLEERARSEGPLALHAELARLDPSAGRSIDPRNVRRVIRALESVQATGGAWSGRSDLWEPAYYFPTLVVGLVAEREALYRRIDARTGRMLREGAIEEVRSYRSGRPEEETAPGGPGIRSAIGYREICAYLEGTQGLDQTCARMAAATRGYARRQLTWLRKLRDAIILDVGERSAAEVAETVLQMAVDREKKELRDR